jgi:hypothetical protein
MIFGYLKSVNLRSHSTIQVLADRDYQGINRYHSNSYIPHKKPRSGRLTIEQKQQNQQHARRRVWVENVIRHLKIFRILSSRYRNRRKRFGLRVNLIAELYNYELKFAALS